MDGLDRLTQKIIDDAKARAEEIIKEAEKQAEKVLQEAETKAKTEFEKTEAQARKKAEEILRGFESGANSAGKKMMLSAKRELINMSFKKAMDELENLSDTEYFGIIYKIAGKYKSDKKAELMLSETDFKRIPADFEEKLKEISGGNMTLGETPAAIKNGFILKYGLSEENCSFDSLINTNSEKLQDKVAQIMFA